MATATATLNDIARGDATPRQARALLGSIMGNASAEIAEDVYLALRAWVWKALDQRRRDSELREWQDIISAVASMIRDVKRDLSAKLAALQELLWESVTIGERLATVDVTKRQHVSAVLAFLDGERGSANRVEIGRRLSLRQANLSRVLTLMTSAGLLERLTLGKEATFRLTRAGLHAAAANREAGGSTRVAHTGAADKAALLSTQQFMATMAKLLKAGATPRRSARGIAKGETTDAGRHAHMLSMAAHGTFAPGARIEEASPTSARLRYDLVDRVVVDRRVAFRPELSVMADG